MSAADWRGVLVLPILIITFFFVGDGLVLPAALSGVALGWCIFRRES